MIADGVGGAARGDIASSAAVDAIRKLDTHRPATRPPTPWARSPAPSTSRTTGWPRSSRRTPSWRAPARRSPPWSSTAASSRWATSATAAATCSATASCAGSRPTTPWCRAWSTRAGSPSRRPGSTRTATSSSRPSTASTIPSPTCSPSPVEPGDRMLLCSDGCSGVLDDEQMAALLGAGDLDDAAAAPRPVALEAGSSDNVTVVLAEVLEGEPSDQPAARRRRRRGRDRSAPPAHATTPRATSPRVSLADLQRRGRARPRGAALRPAPAASVRVGPPAGGPRGARAARRARRGRVVLLVAGPVLRLRPGRRRGHLQGREGRRCPVSTPITSPSAPGWRSPTWSPTTRVGSAAASAPTVSPTPAGSWPTSRSNCPEPTPTPRPRPRTPNADHAAPATERQPGTRHRPQHRHCPRHRPPRPAYPPPARPRARRHDHAPRRRQPGAQPRPGALMEFVHRRRRGAELFLLVLSLCVGLGAYAAVGLGVDGAVPADMIGYGGWLAVAGHRGPCHDPAPRGVRRPDHPADRLRAERPRSGDDLPDQPRPAGQGTARPAPSWSG